MTSPTPFPDPGAPAAPVSRISHLSLRTPRLDAMVDHYTRILGLIPSGGSGSTVHLACADGTTALELTPGDAVALNHLAFDLRAEHDLDSAARALERAGLAPEDWKGVSPAGTTSIGLTDPDGASVQLLLRPQRYAATAQPHAGAGVQPYKLGHVASKVDKLEEVVGFYQKALGFRYSDSIGDDFVFLRCNTDHHSVNFLRTGAPRNIHHVAFELVDWAHVKTTCDELWSHGIPIIWGPGRHGPGHNIFTYHRDPDGNIVELFTELDRMSDEAAGTFDWRPWHAGPQHPRRWDPVAADSDPWGNRPPDGFLA